MKITFLGHAGMFVETRHGSVLCDPWFNPAYFASWFPFPSNEGIDLEKIARPTYLYLSHLHHDHFDPEFLAQHVWKETTVLLPAYPLDHLERELRSLGFTKFLKTKNSEPVEVDGLRFMIMAMIAPIDGPIGDSSLMIDDGETRMLDQNDSRPVDIDLLNSFGPYDLHFLQFSGAIWYPMVYQFPEKMMQALGRKKRENEMARALRYAQQIGATHVIPSAGPPCFLDDDLYSLNDFDRDPTNTFPDQTVFVEYLREHEMENGHLMIPGTTLTHSADGCMAEHPLPDDEVHAIFAEKRAYLDAYKARKQPLIDTLKASWPRGQVDILASLREWFEPLMAQADITCVGINGSVVLDYDTGALVMDFQQRKVYAWNGEEWDYRFHMAPELLEYCIVHHVEDWINEIFLSCRFEAQRKGAYNEYIYNFFKCLSPERLQYAEGYYAERTPEKQFFEAEGYRIQRRCPHMKADLTRFGKIENGILTCTMHGWQFELATGRCLTSDDRRLYAQPLNASEGAADANGAQETANMPIADSAEALAIRCKHCWYYPDKEKPARAKATEA